MEATGMAAVMPVIAASATTMGAASAVGRASMQAGHMAATAAASMGASLANGDASSAMGYAAEVGATTAAAGTGAAAAAVLAAGSVGMAATGAATAMAIVAASGMHDLGTAAASAMSSAGNSALEAVMGPEPNYRRDHDHGEWVTDVIPANMLPGASSGLTGLGPFKQGAKVARRSSRQAGCCSCMPFFSRSRQRTAAQQSSLKRSESSSSRPSEAAPELPQAGAPELATPALSAAARRALEEVESSRSTLAEHTRNSPWHPTVLLYDASPDPPPMCSALRKPRAAYRLPLNSRQPCPIDNEHFEGNFLFLHRLPGNDQDGKKMESPYEWHFEKKTRRWEARVQGRFRRKPTGKLWTGCVLEDFDYSTEQSWAAGALATAVVPLMEAVVGERFYFAWGTRAEAAEREDAELATIVTNLAGTDQVIHTPSTEPVPGIDSDISNLGLRRNAMSASEYRQAVQGVVDQINTEDTYTFCVWGCSRYIDVMSSSFTTPALGAFSYAGFLDEWPAHFILYSLEDDENDPRHLERKKTYFVDVMVWSSDMDLPKLPQRYNFRDERTRRPVQAPSPTEQGQCLDQSAGSRSPASGWRQTLSRRSSAAPSPALEEPVGAADVAPGACKAGWDAPAGVQFDKAGSPKRRQSESAVGMNSGQARADTAY